MKLLHTIPSVDPRGGGVVECVRQICASTKETVTHEILSLDDPSSDLVRNYPVLTHAMGKCARENIGWSHPLAHFGFNPAYPRWLKQHAADYDAIIVHGLWNYTDLAAAQVLPGAGVPYFVFIHGMMDPWFRKRYPHKHFIKQLLWFFSEGKLLKHTKSAIFTTEEERQLSHGQFMGASYPEAVFSLGISSPPEKTEAQHAAIRAKLPDLGSRKYLLYLSRIHPKKGCDLLIDAFAKVAADMPDTDLVIAGPDQEGWVTRLQAQAEALEIASRIHWPGMLSGDAKWGAYYGAEAFILPSHQENFGIVVAEAMACSKPVLITNKVNIWREVQASGGGVIADDTAVGISELLAAYQQQDKPGLKAMGTAARKGYEANYDADAAGEKIIAYIANILKNN